MAHRLSIMGSTFSNSTLWLISRLRWAKNFDKNYHYWQAIYMLELQNRKSSSRCWALNYNWVRMQFRSCPCIWHHLLQTFWTLRTEQICVISLSVIKLILAANSLYRISSHFRALAFNAKLNRSTQTSHFSVWLDGFFTDWRRCSNVLDASGEINVFRKCLFQHCWCGCK